MPNISFAAMLVNKRSASWQPLTIAWKRYVDFCDDSNTTPVIYQRTDVQDPIIARTVLDGRTDFRSDLFWLQTSNETSNTPSLFHHLVAVSCFKSRFLNSKHAVRTTEMSLFPSNIFQENEKLRRLDVIQIFSKRSDEIFRDSRLPECGLPIGN